MRDEIVVKKDPPSFSKSSNEIAVNDLKFLRLTSKEIYKYIQVGIHFVTMHSGSSSSPLSGRNLSPQMKIISGKHINPDLEREIYMLRKEKADLIRQRNECEDKLRKANIAHHKLNNSLRKKDFELSDKDNEISKLSEKNTKLIQLVELTEHNTTDFNDRSKLLDNKLFTQLSEARTKLLDTENDKLLAINKVKELEAKLLALGGNNKALENINTLNIINEEQRATINKQERQINDLLNQVEEYIRKINKSNVESSKSTQNSLERQLTEQVKERKNLEIVVKKLINENAEHKRYKLNTEYLQEKILSLEKERTELQQRVSRVLFLESELAEHKKIEIIMNTYLGDLNNCIVKDEICLDTQIRFPEDLIKNLSDTKFQLKLLQQKTNIYESEQKSRESYIQELENLLDKSKIELKRVQSEKLKLSFENECNTKKFEYLNRELLNYKYQLNSYLDEEKHNICLIENEALQAESKILYNKNYERISMLEKQVEESRVEIFSLYEKIKETQNINSTTQNIENQHMTEDSHYGLNLIKQSINCISPELNEYISNLRNELLISNEEAKRLRNACSSLDNELNRVHKSIGYMLSNPSILLYNTKILQHKDNPQLIHEKDVAQNITLLQKENNKLIDSLLELSELIGKSVDTTEKNKESVPFETYNVLKVQIEKLERELGEREKRVIRLKEVFSNKAIEFRKAIQCLLGYDVLIEMDGKIKLKSVYGTSIVPSFECFLGKEEELNSLKIVGGDQYPKIDMIKEGLKFYVEGPQQSIPAFLSNFTLSLCQNK